LTEQNLDELISDDELISPYRLAQLVRKLTARSSFTPQMCYSYVRQNLIRTDQNLKINKSEADRFIQKQLTKYGAAV